MMLVSSPMTQFFFYDLSLRMLATGDNMDALLTPFYNLVLGSGDFNFDDVLDLFHPFLTRLPTPHATVCCGHDSPMTRP